MRKFLVLLPLVLIVACEKAGPGPGTVLETEGFKAFPSPRTFDPPGRIYRVDPTGSVFGVTSLKLKSQQGKEEIADYKDTTDISLKQVLETIGVPATKFPVVAALDFERKRRFETKSVSGVREFVDDEQVDQQLPLALGSITIRDDNQYYIIRETVMTDNIDYVSEKSWLVSLGLDAEFQNVVKAHSDLNWGTGKTFSLKKKFDGLRRVWYKAERLVIELPLGAAPGQLPLVKRGKVAPGEFSLSGPVVEQP